MAEAERSSAAFLRAFCITLETPGVRRASSAVDSPAGVRVVRMRRELVQDWASAGGYSADPGSPRKGEGDTLDDDDLGNEGYPRDSRPPRQIER